MADNKIFHSLATHLSGSWQSLYLPVATGFGKQSAGEFRFVPAQAGMNFKVDARLVLASKNYTRVQGNQVVSGGSISFPFKIKDGDDIQVRIAESQYVETNVTGISQANPAVVTMASNLIAEDQLVFMDGGDMAEITAGVYRANNVTSTTFELQTEDGVDIDSSAYTVWSAGGTVALHLGDAFATFYEETIPQA